ncbi:hypothetical protein BsWGS_12073 [Bradybaena similaris]
MNGDTNSAATTFSRPTCKLNVSNCAEQRNNNIQFVQIRNDILQPGVRVSSTNAIHKEIVNIGEANCKYAKNQKDHNLILQDRSLFPGVHQAAGVSQTISGWCLHPQELSTTLDIQGHKTKTCGGLTAHSSPCYERVQSSSSSISGNLKKEAKGPEEPLETLHVSSCNGINTFEIVSNNILPKQRLRESDKVAEAVVSEHRLCDFCTEVLSPVCYLTSAKPPTKHFDFTADLQCKTSFSNLGISRSSKIYSDNVDNSSDETVKYRTNLREQCKRHHDSKHYTVVKHDTSIKNTFVLQDIDNLGFPSYVLTPQGTHCEENRHSGDLHRKTRKHRHRRKYEIGKNLVSENKATTLQVYNSETAGALRPGPQDKDFSKLLNCKLHLPPPPGSAHKESPRARFERDRAARNRAAISSKSDSSPGNLAAFCITEPTIAVKEPENVKSIATEKSAGHTYKCQNINTSERSDNLPYFRHQSRSELVDDFNRALSFDSVSDTGVFRQGSTRDNRDSVIENRLNTNIKSHQQPRLASDLCIEHRLPRSGIDEQLEHFSQFVNDLFCEEAKDNPQNSNDKYIANQLQCAQCQTEIYKLSVRGEATPKRDSASADNSCEVSRAGNNTTETHDPASSSDSHQFEHLTDNNPFAISISNCSPCAQMNTSGKRMLASRGLRIYDYVGDANTVLNPDKPIDLQSACASSFHWEGATYLILPTVLDSLTAISASNTSNGATIGNNELLIHRSVSDSGVTTHTSVTSDRSNNLLVNDSNRDVNIKDNFSSASSRNKRLSFKQRSLSVDVLCAGDDSNIGFISVPAESHNTSEDNISAGRGYVEWRTCSTWLRKPDLEINLEKNSQGYVEWDNIWAAAQPRLGEGKDDEHLYDSVGNYNLYSSNENITDSPRQKLLRLPNTIETPHRKEFLSLAVTTETPSREESHSLAVNAETPPALPERTYISRLKKCSSAQLSPSCLEVPTSNYHHRHHHRHHDISNLRKYHNHCHHNHNSNSKQKQHASAASSTVTAPLTKSSKHSTSAFSKQCKHISGSSENGLHPQSSSNDSTNFQNYATVHKLGGYRFNNSATTSESSVPNFPNKLPISSENYCHLAPLASKENMVSLQTSDILDYIDGLHDSMSPKRRENIYILLNNKQTRAKFSESLEIESRLLSRGLISGSSGSEPLEDTLRERRTVCSKTTQGMFNFEMPRRKGVTAPVSSTYV